MNAPAELSRPRTSIPGDGLRPPIPRLAETNEPTRGRRDEASHALRSRSILREWFGDDIARTQVRIDHLAQIERRQRARAALRAKSFWDEDRRLLAEDLGARLHRDPARVIKKLRATPQGCDWIRERWALLLEISRAGHPWNDAQAALALDLLGTPADLREDATTARLLDDPAGLARVEMGAIQDQRAQVVECDELDRALAIADIADPATPEFRELRRYEASLVRRMKWAMDLMDLIPESAEPIRPHERQAPDPEPEPEPPTRRVAVAPTPAMQTAPRSHRPDPAKLRAQARLADRQRRQDRPDR